MSLGGRHCLQLGDWGVGSTGGSDQSGSGGSLWSNRGQSKVSKTSETFIREEQLGRALLGREGDCLLSRRGAESQVVLSKECVKWDSNLATPYIQP